jgi:hypothetical protein
MRVDNRVTQVPAPRTREADHEATSRSPADNERNCTRVELLQNPNCNRELAGGGNSAGKMVNVLFGRPPTKRSQKATRREVLNIEPAVPTPLR